MKIISLLPILFCLLLVYAVQGQVAGIEVAALSGKVWNAPLSEGNIVWDFNASLDIRMGRKWHLKPHLFYNYIASQSPWVDGQDPFENVFTQSRLEFVQQTLGVGISAEWELLSRGKNVIGIEGGNTLLFPMGSYYRHAYAPPGISRKGDAYDKMVLDSRVLLNYQRSINEHWAIRLGGGIGGMLFYKDRASGNQMGEYKSYLIQLGMDYDWKQRKMVKKNKKQVKTKNQETSSFFQIQGGFLLDRNEYKNYSGFNYLSLGIAQIDKKGMRGIDLDGFKFKKLGADFSGLAPDSTYYFVYDWHRWKSSIEATFYKMARLNQGDGFLLYAGPLAAIGYSADTVTENDPMVFHNIDYDLRLGIGGKIHALIRIRTNLFLNLGTKLILLDMGFHRDKIDNQLLTKKDQITDSFKFDFLRAQFYFPLGVTFLL